MQSGGSLGLYAARFCDSKQASAVANSAQPPLHFTLWITLANCPMKSQGWLTYEKWRVEKEVTAALIRKKKKSQHAIE